MAHNHSHNHSTQTKNLGIAIGLNVVITFIQLVGGVIISSMALLTDALHNFMDVAALVISLAAIQLAKKPSDNQHSFGYKRAETLAAFINSLAIVVVALLILFESSRRLLGEQHEVQGNVMVWLAGVAILINGFSAWLLHKDSSNNMNIRSAFLHLVSDTLFSAAVLFSGLGIIFFKIYWLDSVLSVVIALYLIYSSLPLLKKSARIIMQFSPREIDVEEIVLKVSKLSKVVNIHHIHVWELDEHQTHLEAHVEFAEDLSLKEVNQSLMEISKLLKIDFGIQHVTLQPEYQECLDVKKED